MTSTTTTNTTTAEQLADQLAAARAVADTRRADQLAREKAAAAHSRARAALAAQTRHAERVRSEREAAARALANVASLRRKAAAAGERTRITAQMARTGEARALRLDRLRRGNLRLLVPVLLGFAAWSTVGVQHGAARLMDVTSAAPMWWVLWLLEPVLIGAVAWVIVARAALRAAGGAMADSANRIAAACLTASIALNLIASAPLGSDAWGWGVVGAMAAHAIGPVGAAATAHLIGAVDRSIGLADPWHEDGRPVPSLADLDLTPDALSNTLQDTPESALEPLPTPVWEIAWAAPESALKLPLVALPTRRAITSGEPVQERSQESRRSAPDQGEDRNSEVVQKSTQKRSQERVQERSRQSRVDKGRTLPSALKTTSETSPRRLSDDDLADRLMALQKSGAITADSSKTAMQSALGIGYARLQRVLDIVDSRPLPGQLNLVDDTAA